MTKKNDGSTQEQVAMVKDKLNSRVTKAHIVQLNEAMAVALDNTQNVAQRLGYLSFAVATVLKEVGLPEAHKAMSARMWANFGVKPD